MVFHSAWSPRQPGAAQITEFRQMLRPGVRESFGAVTYEEVAMILARHGEEPLANWIRDRIATGLQTKRSA